MAFETVLGAPCYHFEELFRHPDKRKTWARFASGETEMDWQAVYTGYEAAVDFPSCAYYEEIAEAFPDALVVLSVRELESWARSWHSLWRFYFLFRLPLFTWPFSWVAEIVQIIDAVIVERSFAGSMDPASMITTHQAHIDRVQQVIPAQRLLVFRVQDGWEPLCEALGVSVPDQPFPRSNAGSWPFVERILGKMFGRRWKKLSEG